MTSIDFKSRIASNLQLAKKKKKKPQYMQASIRKKAKTIYPYNNFLNINITKLSNHIYMYILYILNIYNKWKF